MGKGDPITRGEEFRQKTFSTFILFQLGRVNDIYEDLILFYEEGIPHKSSSLL